MTQYALMNNCIPLCLIEEENDFINPKSWLLHPEKIDFVFFNMEELLEKVDNIMKEDSLVNYTDCVISREEFRKYLLLIMEGEKSPYLYHEENVEVSSFHKSYDIRLEQQSLKNIIHSTTNKWIREKYADCYLD